MSDKQVAQASGSEAKWLSSLHEVRGSAVLVVLVSRPHGLFLDTTRLNQMWGRYGTRVHTRRDGWRWFSGAIDHASGKVVGHHVAKIGDRLAAFEPSKQSITDNFGHYAGTRCFFSTLSVLGQ
jgi:hypothetical protein